MNEGFIADRAEFEWLTKHASGWQFGEQGILAAISEAIGVTDGQCVEIGAGDGESLPLTIDPFYQRGNPCVLFERDAESLGRLMIAYPKATHCGEFSPDRTSLIQNMPLVVSIDVDGIDSTIMDDVLESRTPFILMVEHFDKCHHVNTTQIQRVPEWLLGLAIDGGFTIQDNAATLNVIAERHNYTRIGTTRVNSIFVHDSLVEKVKDHVSS
jgi:hypothetical protein